MTSNKRSVVNNIPIHTTSLNHYKTPFIRINIGFINTLPFNFKKMNFQPKKPSTIKYPHLPRSTFTSNHPYVAPRFFEIYRDGVIYSRDSRIFMFVSKNNIIKLCNPYKDYINRLYIKNDTIFLVANKKIYQLDYNEEKEQRTMEEYKKEETKNINLKKRKYRMTKRKRRNTKVNNKTNIIEKDLNDDKNNSERTDIEENDGCDELLNKRIKKENDNNVDEEDDKFITGELVTDTNNEARTMENDKSFKAFFNNQEFNLKKNSSYFPFDVKIYNKKIVDFKINSIGEIIFLYSDKLEVYKNNIPVLVINIITDEKPTFLELCAHDLRTFYIFTKYNGYKIECRTENDMKLQIDQYGKDTDDNCLYYNVQFNRTNDQDNDSSYMEDNNNDDKNNNESSNNKNDDNTIISSKEEIEAKNKNYIMNKIKDLRSYKSIDTSKLVECYEQIHCEPFYTSEKTTITKVIRYNEHFIVVSDWIFGIILDKTYKICYRMRSCSFTIDENRLLVNRGGYFLSINVLDPQDYYFYNYEIRDYLGYVANDNIKYYLLKDKLVIHEHNNKDLKCYSKSKDRMYYVENINNNKNLCKDNDDDKNKCKNYLKVIKEKSSAYNGYLDSNNVFYLEKEYNKIHLRTRKIIDNSIFKELEEFDKRKKVVNVEDKEKMEKKETATSFTFSYGQSTGF
ncbi:hypothetical protein SLOPH_624 [Spraguea lophii 42_110]|uniref:Uncharacterized protein n=1 Tax=Spraguea lophii (strain 42_110) TaxID=1358809 RepID=S7W810_SPRLO|nr:hypothetical protein SLOPH_624 [Spraguea lophii 42_110]